MKICSACLLGINCRYNGERKPNEKVISLSKNEILIPVCPEQLGGLPTPRPGVQSKNGIATSADGIDFSKQFKQGAEEVLLIAKLYNIKEAILKQRSPSCGCGQIYDGNFSGKVIEGDGITTKLLKENGINIKTEEDL